MKQTTLTRTLFFRITPILLTVIALIGGLAFISASHEINSVYDAQLKNNAEVLWQLAKNELNEPQHKASATASAEEPDETDFSDATASEDYFGNARMFRIWSGKKIVMLSDTAFDSGTARPETNGFSEVIYKGERWRIYQLAVPGRAIWIEVGEKNALRETLVNNILVDLFLPLFVLIPLIGIVLWYGIRSGLDVTHALVSQIQRRSPDDLSPITVNHLPDDLAPVGLSINKLLVKLQASIHAERRFADHAAHQLRTPLAGTKLLIQMLATADTDAERRYILEDLATSNEQATQLVNKLLIGARISHQPLTLHAIPLYPAIAEVVSDLSALISQKRLRVSLAGDEEASVNADQMLLALLLGNILENAVKYTPEGGSIDVTVTNDDNEESYRVTVRDTGPGIPEEEKALVFERFYRSNTPESEGVGLGLSIVADIIDRLQGDIELITPAGGQGLQVDIRLPKP